MRVKHSKFRNTGILFELLVRQIAADTLANNDPKAVKIIKRFFTNSELAKEHKLYHTIITAPRLSEAKAETLISTTVDMAKKLDKLKLDKEKYNLIKEIKKQYDLETFFQSKISNYKVLASAYTLFEASMVNKFIEPKLIIINKITLLEHITKKPLTETKVQSDIDKQLRGESKEVRLLAYRMLIEKFNNKYSVLNNRQKLVLKEYINKQSDPAQLKEYINSSLISVKNELTELKSKIDDKVTEIKLNEVINLINPIPAKASVKDEHVISLLQYFQLTEEIKKVK